jgi:Ca2+-binding RTX toxin-like protein
MTLSRRQLQLDPVIDGFSSSLVSSQLAKHGLASGTEATASSQSAASSAAAASVSPSEAKETRDTSDGASETKIKGTAGADTVTVTTEVSSVKTLGGADAVTIAAGADVDRVDLGTGNDIIRVSGDVDRVTGGAGQDTLVLDWAFAQYDVILDGKDVVLLNRLTGHEIDVRKVETFVLSGVEYSVGDLQELLADDGVAIVVDHITRIKVITPDPTISVIWDQIAQQAIAIDSPGPTVSARTFAMVHTAMYDAWASYDEKAARVSIDLEGDNIRVSDPDGKEKAMSYAAYNVLKELFPKQAALFETVMSQRLGFSLTDDGSLDAQVGIDAAQDLMALRLNDGANQAGGYKGTFIPTNPDQYTINDISAWTPESTPIDSPPGSKVQSFLTPQWSLVEGFALPELADGTTDFGAVRPVGPRPFFAEGMEGSTLDMVNKTITLGAAVRIGDTEYEAGAVVAVSKALIGPVVNQGFIDQAQQLIDMSVELSDERKVIAEFWEDGKTTAFPPGTLMTFAEYVSGRDEHTVDQDAVMFLAMGNAMLDASIAAWEAKLFYDYARPVRVIRDLGELGLIGELGTDEVTGETGFVIYAYAEDPETGAGLGARTILAENFVTYQPPGTAPSPAFPDYVSGHSTFSAAGAAVLRDFTGSDVFGASVNIPAGSSSFGQGVPAVGDVLSWDTFTDMAREAGMSRMYTSIHFLDANLDGAALGTNMGVAALDLAQQFAAGTITEPDLPFYGDTIA